MRKRSLFNNDWLYCANKLSLDAPDEQFEPVTLPHPNKIFPHHNFDNKEYQFISTYRKRFNLAIPAGQLIFLDFDGVMIACTVYMNGMLLCEHLGGFISFSVDITSAVQPGENLLTVYVDSTERTDVPPYGHLVDYLTFGGIYRDVHLTFMDQTHIENIFVKPSDVLTAPRLACDVQLNQVLPQLTLEAVLLDRLGHEVAATRSPVEDELTTLHFDPLPDVHVWSLDEPALYTVSVSLLSNGQSIDSLSTRFGFREAIFRPDGGFYLNGERLQLVGLDRHQTYPFIGPAAPPRLQRLDADIIKNELGLQYRPHVPLPSIAALPGSLRRDRLAGV